MYVFHDNSNIEYLFRGAQIRCFKDPPGENVFADCTVLCFFIVFFFKSNKTICRLQISLIGSLLVMNITVYMDKQSK